MRSVGLSCASGISTTNKMATVSVKTVMTQIQDCSPWFVSLSSRGFPECVHEDNRLSVVYNKYKDAKETARCRCQWFWCKEIVRSDQMLVPVELIVSSSYFRFGTSIFCWMNMSFEWTLALTVDFANDALATMSRIHGRLRCAVADILNDVLHKSYYLPFNMQDVLRTARF